MTEEHVEENSGENETVKDDLNKIEKRLILG